MTIRRAGPGLAAFLVILGITAVLHAPVLGDLRNLRILGAFHDDQVWAFERMARMLTRLAANGHWVTVGDRFLLLPACVLE